jgi:hypothetical protein
MKSKGETCFMRDYCAVIRTLGTVGEKYQRLLDSLAAQAVTPKKKLVYIPHGYVAPKETIGIEQLVRCEKGMVAQRSFPFDEVDTDYILFCDDDLYLPPDYVEELFIGIEENDTDCIAAEVFYHYKDSLWKRLMFYLSKSFSPRGDDGYAYIIKRDGVLHIMKPQVLLFCLRKLLHLHLFYVRRTCIKPFILMMRDGLILFLFLQRMTRCFFINSSCMDTKYSFILSQELNI